MAAIIGSIQKHMLLLLFVRFVDAVAGASHAAACVADVIETVTGRGECGRRGAVVYEPQLVEADSQIEHFLVMMWLACFKLLIPSTYDVMLVEACVTNVNA